MSTYTQFQNQQTIKLIKLAWELIENHTDIPHSDLQESTAISSLKYLQQINKIQPPVDRHQLQTFQNALHWQQINKPVRIKYYCSVIVACLEQNNQNDAKTYFDWLLTLLQNPQDIQKATYFLFNVLSLAKIRNYQISQNRQFKYDKITQLLFYYILSALKPEQHLLINSTLTALYESVKEMVSQKPFIATLYDQNQSKPSITFAKNAIRQILQIELQSIKQPKPKTSKNEHLFQQYLQISKHSKEKNQKIIQIQALLKRLQKQTYYQMMMGELSQTNLFKKLLKNKQYKEIETKDKKYQIADYLKKIMKQGEGSITRFKNCKIGMYLLKYNYDNDVVDWRFVKIGQEGIFWGKDAQHIKFKYQWTSVVSLVYGKVSQNIAKKCKYICHNRIFSLILPNRSIDFVCQNEEEVMTWLQGITYILNKTKQQHSEKQTKPNSKVFFSKGKILWKSLFLKLSLQSKNMLAKSEGIRSHEGIVSLHYKQVKREKKI